MKRGLLLFGCIVAAACAESHGASVSDSVAGETMLLRIRNAALDESLRVVRNMTERQSIEKDLLVREVHSFDYFMEQLQDEFRRIRVLQRQAGSLDPRSDPLSSLRAEKHWKSVHWRPATSMIWMYSPARTT